MNSMIFTKSIFVPLPYVNIIRTFNYFGYIGTYFFPLELHFKSQSHQARLKLRPSNLLVLSGPSARFTSLLLARREPYATAHQFAHIFYLNKILKIGVKWLPFGIFYICFVLTFFLRVKIREIQICCRANISVALNKHFCFIYPYRLKELEFF